MEHFHDNLLENHSLQNNFIEDYNENITNRYTYSYFCLGLFICFLIFFIIKDIIL
jgi:hypothetical protein